jgi:hypothetical protein
MKNAMRNRVSFGNPEEKSVKTGRETRFLPLDF